MTSKCIWTWTELHQHTFSIGRLSWWFCSWELGEARKKDALDRARVRGKQIPPELLAEERGCIRVSKLRSRSIYRKKRMINWKLYSLRLSRRCNLVLPRWLNTGKLFLNGSLFSRPRPLSRKSVRKFYANICSAFKNR